MGRVNAKLDVAERTRRILEMRTDGFSLQAIGDAFGITRERVRQIVKQADGPDAAAAHAAAQAQRAAKRNAIRTRALRDYRAHPGTSLEEAAERLALLVDDLRQALPASTLRLYEVERPHAQVWSDEQILEALRTAATMEFPVTTNGYKRLLDDRLVRGPSVPRITQRFGSWTAACDLAGVEPGATRRHGYNRRWSEQDLRTIMANFVRQGGPQTVDAFMLWSSLDDDRPSWGTVRKQFGSWLKALQAGHAELGMQSNAGTATTPKEFH